MIVAFATATRELAAADGSTVPTAEFQAVFLAGVADLFAVVVGKADDIPGRGRPARVRSSRW